uniref:Uncharacterized protein n=1 Tax=Kalanchoe fedtschenkoi TaxID=63787 RepID=A0A7N0RE80_KALFE
MARLMMTSRFSSWTRLCRSYVGLSRGCDSSAAASRIRAIVGGCRPGFFSRFPASRAYARSRDRSSTYNLFNKGKAGYDEFRKAWAKEQGDDDDTGLWTGSEEDEDKDDNKPRSLKDEIRKLKKKAKENSDKIDADDSDELWGVWSGSDEEKTLWTGDECDSDADTPTEPHPNEKSDAYIDKIFEFEDIDRPRYRTLTEALNDEDGTKDPHEELTPGKQARKLAVQNALKKLKKGPDGRYINVFDVMCDLDILVGAFENIVSGPEYAELRKGGPRRLNMDFFRDIQAKMRDPNYEYHQEIKLKPKSKMVARKRWQKTQSRKRKAQKR